jgi:hemerythrin-like domain-containing protein
MNPKESAGGEVRMEVRMANDSPLNDIGLRLRMRGEEKRIASQHAQLNELFVVVTLALERGRVHTAADAFRRFSDALEAHMSLEEDIYFPAIHGLIRDSDQRLIELVDEHRELRADVRHAQALLDAGDRESSPALLEAIAAHVSEHESEEETLIRRITESRNLASDQVKAED